MTLNNGRQGVIFDLDGVLIDSGWAHKQAWFDLAAKEGLRMTDEFFYSTFGMQNVQIIPMLVGKDLPPDELENLSEWKEQRYRSLISGKLVLSPGAEGLLHELKENAFLLAIGSSAPKANLDIIFHRLKLNRYIDAAVTKEEVAQGKPAPETFLRAAQKLSLPSKDCVVVEDAVPGVEAGRAAGMTVVALTTTRDREDLIGADLVVDSLNELKAADFVGLLAGRPRKGSYLEFQ